MKKITKLNLYQLAKEMPVIPEIEKRGFVGGTFQSSGVTWYTVSEFEQLIDNGDWNGGYVDGWGYTAPDTNKFDVSGLYLSFGDTIRSGITGTPDRIALKILEQIPLLGDYLSYYKEQIDKAWSLIHGDMADMGANNSGLYYIDSHKKY
jgi:hypothetical protein